MPLYRWTELYGLDGYEKNPAEEAFVDYWGNADFNLVALRFLADGTAFLLQDPHTPDQFALAVLPDSTDPDRVDEIEVQFKDPETVLDDWEKIYSKSGAALRPDAEGLKALIREAIEGNN